MYLLVPVCPSSYCLSSGVVFAPHTLAKGTDNAANRHHLPGHSEPRPRGTARLRKLTTLLQWGLWLATLLCVGAVVKAGVQIAMASHGRGSGGEHGMTLLMALGGAIVCGVAAAAVTLLFG